jgi:hypothetical protein
MKLQIEPYVYASLKEYWLYSIIQNNEEAKDYYIVYNQIFLFNRE